MKQTQATDEINGKWRNRCVVVVAGGTGGHVFPALAIAQVLRAQGANVHWIGTEKGIESRVVPANHFPIHYLNVQGLRQKSFRRFLAAPWQLLRATLQVILWLRSWRADLVLGMGGYAAGPVGVAAWLARIPLVIHEQNAIAGLTNRWLACIATRILLGFPNEMQQLVGARRCVQVTGNPVRAELLQATQLPRVSTEGRCWRLLVVGGSLGASALNNALPQALALIPLASRPEVRHQTGEKEVASTQKAYESAGVRAQVTAFIEDMAAAYHWADVVVARAGALTVSEIAVMGRASILVPYPHAVDDHQTQNADYLVRAEAADLMPQTQLTPQALVERLNTLSCSIEECWRRGERARSVAYPHAVEDITQALDQVLSKSFS